MPKTVKIVITGGPCAGKSTAIGGVREALKKQGYAVLSIAETATELITGGIAPWSFDNPDTYQEIQMKLQLAKENAVFGAAEKLNSDKVLIVCDRGILDNKAYMSESAFYRVLGENGLSEDEALMRYGAAFHLVTAANGAVEFYGNENNSARTENPDEAREIDDRLIAAWGKHPNFKIFENKGGLEDKINRLICEINSYLNGI